ncbi:His-Xaa-Ser repeat protein HxsA [Pseudophaeobacter sp.]|uniref:His-Xaa-Ser repeat protein HxsA n=1 Tax=Pseudophaeobacter sp. TaxID=1971739 RepID=UPI003298F99C
MKNRKFLVPTLAAAGFLPSISTESAVAAAVPSHPLHADSEFTQRLELEHKYTLAGHRSHSSHSSHRSHRSSSSGGYTTTRPAAPVRPRSNSTNPRTVLPSLPNTRPVAPLPGNSEKFKQIAMRVQLGLISYGYYNGAVDGVIGKQSKAALSRFQSDYGLKVTGTITPEVLNALGITAQ